MPSYVSSSVYHALPERERRVKFNFDAGENHGVQRDAIENENGEEADLRLAIRLQKEENAAALEVRRQKQAETAGVEEEEQADEDNKAWCDTETGNNEE